LLKGLNSNTAIEKRRRRKKKKKTEVVESSISLSTAHRDTHRERDKQYLHLYLSLLGYSSNRDGDRQSY
jgi:hypothetical protein